MRPLCVHSLQVYPLRLAYNEDEDIFRNWIVCCYVAVAFFVVGLSVMLVKNSFYYWRHYRTRLLTNMWIWTDFFIVLSITVSLICAFKLFLSTAAVRKRLKETVVNEFVSLQEVAFWDFIHTSAFATSLSLCVIKFWRLLVFAFERFYVLALTLGLSAGYLLGYMFIFSLLITAFAFWGVLEFGNSIEHFHAVQHGFMELMNQVRFRTGIT